MSIFIQEYACGGGMRNQELTNSLLTEGFGMLNVLIKTFKQQGYTVITSLDERLEKLQNYLPADRVQIIRRQDNFLTKSKQLINQSTYFLIIAPETDKISIKLVDYYQQKTKSTSLNSGSSVIAKLANKGLVYKRCFQQGIKVPKTFLVKKNTTLEITSTTKNRTNELFFQQIDKSALSYPLLIKPNSGTACEGIRKIESQKELLDHIEKSNKEFLIQEFIAGEPFSVTIVITQNTIRILTINKQIIKEEGKKLSYIGGVSNIHPSFAQELMSVSKEILKQFPGIKGLIGIDFLYQAGKKEKKEAIYLLEINPRPTTALCGLLDGRLQTAKRFIDILFGKEMEKKNQFFNEVSYFTKIKIPKDWKITDNLYEEMKHHPEIITPPLSLKGKERELFIRGSGNSIEESREDFEEKKTYWLTRIRA